MVSLDEREIIRKSLSFACQLQIELSRDIDALLPFRVTVTVCAFEVSAMRIDTFKSRYVKKHSGQMSVFLGRLFRELRDPV